MNYDGILKACMRTHVWTISTYIGESESKLKVAFITRLIKKGPYHQSELTKVSRTESEKSGVN